MNPTVCIAGKNEIAVHGLRHFLDHYPDYPLCFIPNAGDAGIDTWQPSFAKQARAWGVRQVSLEEIYGLEDLILISLEFDTIIKTDRFKTRNLFNFHFSKLPKYKGMFTAAHPILNGDDETAVTLHFMDSGIDTGDIIDQKTVDISLHDTVRDVFFKNLNAAKALFEENVARLLSGDFVARPQEMSGASYYSKASINYANLVIDFNRTAFEVHNQFRAFTFREFQMPRFADWSIASTTPTAIRSTLKPGKIVSETETRYRIATIDFDLDLHKDYYPSLWSACEAGDLDAVARGLAFVDEVDLRNPKGWTALIIAAYHGHVPVIRALLERGADPDLGNYKGTTPLMYALSHYEASRDSLAFQTLAASSKALGAVDHYGKTVSDWVDEKGLAELKAYLP